MMKDQLVPELRFEEFKSKWKFSELLSKVEIVKGQVKPNKAPYDNFVLIAPNHIESGSGQLIKKETAKEQGAISGKYLFEPGDVIYSKIRPYLKKAILVDFSGLCSADMYPLRCGDEMSPAFLLPIVLGSRLTKYANSVSYRTGIPKINRTELSQFSLPLPTLPEQQKIATFLSLVDRRLAAAQRRVALLEEWKRGVINKIFCDLSETDHFSLSKVCTFNRGGSLSKADLTTQGIYPCIHYGELFTKYNAVADNILSLTNSEKGKRIPVDSVLMPTSDVTPVGLATATYVGFDGVYAGGDINIITPNKQLNGKYLSYFLNYDKKNIVRLVSGTTVKHIYISDIKTLRIPVPSISIQTQIAENIGIIDARITAAQKEVTGLETWKKGLLQKMLV